MYQNRNILRFSMSEKQLLPYQGEKVGKCIVCDVSYTNLNIHNRDNKMPWFVLLVQPRNMRTIFHETLYDTSTLSMLMVVILIFYRCFHLLSERFSYHDNHCWNSLLSLRFTVWKKSTFVVGVLKNYWSD